MFEQKYLDYRLRRGIILDKDTPTITTSYKEPVTPVTDGYGYYGVFAYNEDMTHVQCHICGYFFKSLGPHCSKFHGLTPVEYRKAFGFMYKTKLTAPDLTKRLVAIHSERIRAAISRPEVQEQRLKNLEKGRSIYKPVSQPRREEWLNQRGRCPEQLIRKIEILAEELGKTPTKRDFIAKYGDAGDLNMIYRTFGTWNSGLRTPESAESCRAGGPPWINRTSLAPPTASHKTSVSTCG